MNDEGQYMFRSYRNEWIADTPTQREAILERLADWRAVSNSSPREGILAAIDTFYDPEKKISLYVYSDDFSAGAGQINAVVREVDRRNTVNAEGEQRVQNSCRCLSGYVRTDRKRIADWRGFRHPDARIVPAQWRHLRRTAVAARYLARHFSSFLISGLPQVAHTCA